MQSAPITTIAPIAVEATGLRRPPEAGLHFLPRRCINSNMLACSCTRPDAHRLCTNHLASFTMCNADYGSITNAVYCHKMTLVIC
jgi:hypothetical protein